MPDKPEEIAIITGIDFGMRDFDSPHLWMYLKLIGGETIVSMTISEAHDFVKETKCFSISHLKGLPCIVQQVDGIVKFRGMLP